MVEPRYFGKNFGEKDSNGTSVIICAKSVRSGRENHVFMAAASQYKMGSRSSVLLRWGHHYRRGKIPRVSLASPSAKNQALGKENLPRVLHSGNNCTRGREVFPSAAEILALGKEQHSAKALFPECNTRGRSALDKETCYLTVHPAHAVKT